VRRFVPWIALLLAGVLSLGALAYLLSQALGGSDLLDPVALEGPALIASERLDPTPWLVAALAGTLIALAGWAFERTRLSRLEREGARHEQLAREAHDEAERARAELASTRTELEQARQLFDREQAARYSERALNRHLREVVEDLHRSHGALGHRDDLPGLVLEVAMELVDAERGLLLRRAPEGEGLAVAAAEGFESDPSESAIARRFADEVIERETIIREEGEDLAIEREAPADHEIENLIAIPVYVEDEFSGAVVCANGERFDDHDEEVLLALGDQAGAVLRNSQLHGDLRAAYLGTVRMLAEALEAKDPHLGGHGRDATEFADVVAERLDFDARRREELRFAALLHDVGKIGISERILLKPDRLTDEEYAVIKLHPRIGYRLVQQVPALEPISLAVLHHHERYDGRGYPAGLSGEEIPLEARIIAVMDAFSAMTADRPYQAAKPVEEACAELEQNAGTQFDPQVVRLFVEAVRERADAEPDEHALTVALDDPELAVRTANGETVVGGGQAEIVDGLTNLYSHRYFHEAAHAEAERSRVQNDGFTIAIAEVAGLDEINMRDGYLAGDRAIQDAAARVRAVADRHGGVACRYGGRRLALLVPGRAIEVTDLADELGEATDGLRVGAAAWAPGEAGDTVIARARLELSGAQAQPA
jgi:HD-GYP domain-containing protein (c-di-GMP phosphodiesterase class II)